MDLVPELDVVIAKGQDAFQPLDGLGDGLGIAGGARGDAADQARFCKRLQEVDHLVDCQQVERAAVERDFHGHALGHARPKALLSGDLDAGLVERFAQLHAARGAGRRRFLQVCQSPGQVRWQVAVHRVARQELAKIHGRQVHVCLLPGRVNDWCPFRRQRHLPSRLRRLQIGCLSGLILGMDTDKGKGLRP